MPEPPRRPNVVGRYVLLDRIASGGMASVHFGRAIGAVGFSRIVAIKRLHPAFARDAEIAGMFADEARLASRVKHPNVVATLDVVAEAETLAVVMDYVHGEALHELLRRGGRVALGVASAIATGVLEGLHAAHEARGSDGAPLGIVHRDVSPPNVIVGVDGVARLIDFGVAKATRKMQETRGRPLKGKIAYMAPEQMKGAGVDRRSDVYSAAVVLWEMLTGARLFDGANDAAAMAQVLEMDVPPPSARAPDVPRSLDALVLRGLARDPDARFATARQMAAALETIARPLPARDVGRWVESVAAEALAARATLVSMLESASPDELTERSGQEKLPDEDEATTLYVSEAEMVAVAPVSSGPRPLKPAAPAPPAAPPSAAQRAPQPRVVREGATAVWLRSLPLDPLWLRVVVGAVTFAIVLALGAAAVALTRC